MRVEISWLPWDSITTLRLNEGAPEASECFFVEVKEVTVNANESVKRGIFFYRPPCRATLFTSGRGQLETGNRVLSSPNTLIWNKRTHKVGDTLAHLHTAKKVWLEHLQVSYVNAQRFLELIWFAFGSDSLGMILISINLDGPAFNRAYETSALSSWLPTGPLNSPNEIKQKTNVRPAVGDKIQPSNQQVNDLINFDLKMITETPRVLRLSLRVRPDNQRNESLTWKGRSKIAAEWYSVNKSLTPPDHWIDNDSPLIIKTQNCGF